MSRSLVARFGAWPTLLALLLTAAPASAQNYFWNAPNGGTGNWNAATIWSTTSGGPVDYTWANNGTEVANFGNTAGTVTIPDATNITAAGINFTTDGYSINRLGTGKLILGGTGGPIDVSTGNATINSVIDGTAGLTKSGVGTLTLSGINTYTGVTNINVGTVITTASAGLGATGASNNTIVANGASVTVGDNIINVGEAITLNGTGVANAGALRKIGTTNSTWSGAITLGSTTRINSDTTGLFTISGAVGGGANSLTVGGTGSTTISSVVTTSGTFTKDGAGTLTLSANNSATLSGPIVINGGVVSIPLSTSLGTNVGTVTLDGGTLRNTNAGSGGSFIGANRNLVIGPNGGTVEYTTGVATNSSIYAGTITGTGTLTKTGNGEFRYQGTGLPNTTFTKLVVNQGLYRLGFASSTSDERGFGAVPASPLADAITLNGGAIGTSFTATLHVNRGITLGASGGSFNTTAAPLAIPGVISGSGALNKDTAGQLTISGANTYTGVTNISAGTLLLGATNTLPSGSTVRLNGGTLRTGNPAGFAQAAGTLDLDASSTITLGTGGHVLNFAGLAASPTGTLTVVGWTGEALSQGTAGRIVFNSNTNFTQAFLDSVQFAGFPLVGASLLDVGGGQFELTPVPEPATVLAVGAAGLGLAGLGRRLRRRSVALAA